ncbi:MAG: hypothetical protein JXL84_24365, partial [Deltaproteobacteria bacterium]|nr:hypothetical protein [Deltaproteobacteria bacterium]
LPVFQTMKIDLRTDEGKEGISAPPKRKRTEPRFSLGGISRPMKGLFLCALCASVVRDLF